MLVQISDMIMIAYFPDCIDAYVHLIRTLGMKIGWQNILAVLGYNTYENLQKYYVHH